MATFKYRESKDSPWKELPVVGRVGLMTDAEGEIEITENGTHDVAQYASAKVSVEQPEIFAPIVVEMFNEVQWKNNEKNGKFAVIITAMVNGEEVTSPLTITEELNGKNLVIKAECENFKSTEQIIPLIYHTLDMSDATHSVFFTSGVPNAPTVTSYQYEPVFELYNAKGLAGEECKAFMNGVMHQRESGEDNFYHKVKFNELHKEEFYFEVTEPLSNAICYPYLLYRRIYTNGFYQTSGGSNSISWTSGTIKFKIYVNGELRGEATRFQSYTYLGEVTVGDRITFFVEAHVAN
jgi:hypothetical protein